MINLTRSVAKMSVSPPGVIPHPPHPTFMLADRTGAAREDMLRGEKHRVSM